MEKYYEKPDWIKGNIFQSLKEDGNYTIFLKGIELAGFKQMVDGKSILTVMAPNDDAFKTYLQAHYNTFDIEDLTLEELKKLIGFHLMYYSYGTDRLINYRPLEGDGVSKDQKAVMAGMYYKHRTKSSDPVAVEWDNLRRDSVSVYHLERYLPVFSYLFFQTKQIDAKYNYEYFFPDTEWRGGNSGFNVSNAAVDAYEIIASNGYIYKVDKVLRPLETIYTELKSRPDDFSYFLEMYDKTKFYTKEENLSLQYGNGTSLYLIEHNPLANIASEWPTPDHTQMARLSSESYSVFAPTNQALDDFFDDYWRLGGYESLSFVSQSSINYLLQNSYYPSDIIFPDEIKRGDVENSYGTIISFDVDAVPYENRILCLNGVLYGNNILTPPAMFGSITGPAFQYKDYSHYLRMLTNNGNDSQLEVVKPLTSNETRYLSLIPSNEMIEEAGMSIHPRNDVLMRGTAAVGVGEQKSYVYAHTVNLDGVPGNYRELQTSGVQVLRTLLPDYRFYWYVIDGKLTTSMKFRELIFPEPPALDDLLVDFEELSFRGGEWSNGKVYAYDKDLFESAWNNALVTQPNFQRLMYNLGRNDETVPYYGFVNLLNKSGLYDSQNLNFIFEPYFAFIPKTQAVKSALEAGKIPGIEFDETIGSEYYFDNYKVTDEEALQRYLKMYFLPLSTAEMTNFPYVGWGESPEALPTYDEYEKEFNGSMKLENTNLEIKDTGSKLQIKVKEAGHTFIDVTSDYYYLPLIFQDGALHFIETCFDKVN